MRAFPLSVIRMIMLGAFWHPGTADWPGTREPSEQFYTDATRPSDLASFPRKGNHHVYALSYAGPGSPCCLLGVVLSRLLAENENHHGGTGAGWEGNTHL